MKYPFRLVQASVFFLTITAFPVLAFADCALTDLTNPSGKQYVWKSAQTDVQGFEYQSSCKFSIQSGGIVGSFPKACSFVRFNEQNFAPHIYRDIRSGTVKYLGDCTFSIWLTTGDPNNLLQHQTIKIRGILAPDKTTMIGNFIHVDHEGDRSYSGGGPIAVVRIK